jgi:hypothetical protein
MRVDAESLAFVLRGRALCRECLADNLDAARDEVHEACRTLVVPQRSARCDGCQKQTIVHLID